jgi:hypothetical protein
VDYKDDNEWQEWKQKGMQFLLNKIRDKKKKNEGRVSVHQLEIKEEGKTWINQLEYNQGPSTMGPGIKDRINQELQDPVEEMRRRTETVEDDEFSDFCSLDGGSAWKWNDRQENKVVRKCD